MMDDDDLDAQIKRVMQEKVIKQATEIIKGAGVQFWQYVTANSVQAQFRFGSPVLTGRFYQSHNISLNNIETKTAAPNTDDAPYQGQPLTTAVAVLAPFKLGDTIYYANALPYAPALEKGYSAKAPEGIYQVAADLIRVQYKDVKVATK